VGSIYDGFQAANRVIRQHTDWPDEQVAEVCGIRDPWLIAQTVVPARREWQAEQPAPPEVTTTYEAP
jgi:hypothetical protein